jgi:hypothetical protein
VELKEKPPGEGGFLLFYSLFSEYQVQTDFVPDFHRNFGVEMLLYQGLLLLSGGERA